jgi:hypothetical protein
MLIFLVKQVRKMKLPTMLTCAWVVVFLAGCSSSSPVKESPQEQYAMVIKRRVRDVEKVVRQPKEAQARIEGMTEDLDMYEKRSAPEHKEVYKELQTIQKELVAGFKSGSPSDLAAKVQKMKELCDKLPGTIDQAGGPAPPPSGR